MNIGIFDSGIGGITLLHQAIALLPRESYIFYADTDHVPYGTKSKEEVIGYVDEVMRFMSDHDCKAVVIACNTATAAAAETMRRRYRIPIIGIEPAVKPAVGESRGRRVLVVATPLTIRDERFRRLVARVDDAHLVDMLPLPRLVEFAENGEFESNAELAYLEEAFSPYDLDSYGELVLGCTHFNYFKDSFRRLLPPQVRLIDGSEGTIRQLARVLEERGELEPSSGETEGKADTSVRYFYSGREITDAEGLRRIAQLHQRLERMQDIR
ncbi:MAG: glutamate racemase [Roseburia sp.]|nr:glutamate racemase [Roseburia sp.]